MSDKIAVSCVVAFVLSMCAMCGAFVSIDAGILDAQSMLAQTLIMSPAIVFALSLWAVEIAEQIERKKAQQ